MRDIHGKALSRRLKTQPAVDSEIINKGLNLREN
jgi:hypothetical protein